MFRQFLPSTLANFLPNALKKRILSSLVNYGLDLLASQVGQSPYGVVIGAFNHRELASAAAEVFISSGGFNENIRRNNLPVADHEPYAEVRQEGDTIVRTFRNVPEGREPERREVPAASQEFQPLESFLQSARQGNHARIQNVIVEISDPAALNIQDEQTGNTAMHYAAIHGQRALADVLLMAEGINLDIVNRAGLTAAAEAQRHGHFDLAIHLTTLNSLRHLSAQQPAQQELAKPSTPKEKNKSFSPKKALQSIGYDGPIPHYMICPFSLCIMRDPIELDSGIACERKWLINYFNSKGNPPTLPCPKKRVPISIKCIERPTSVALKAAIMEFVEKRVKEAPPQKPKTNNDNEGLAFTRAARLRFFEKISAQSQASTVSTASPSLNLSQPS